jgi:hypothetical protein
MRSGMGPLAGVLLRGNSVGAGEELEPNDTS